MTSRTLVAVATAVVLGSTWAPAATIRVPKDQPTIQAAIDAAANGDTIKIGKGTYPSFVVSGRKRPGPPGQGKAGGRRSVGAGMEIGNSDSAGTSTGNLIERNRILKSGGDGIYVEDTGNVFRRNKAKKSGGSDLRDTTGPDGNTYEDNKFGSEDFSP